MPEICGPPTIRHFTITEPLTSSIDVSQLHKIRRTTNVEVLNYPVYQSRLLAFRFFLRYREYPEYTQKPFRLLFLEFEHKNCPNLKYDETVTTETGLKETGILLLLQFSSASCRHFIASEKFGDVIVNTVNIERLQPTFVCTNLGISTWECEGLSWIYVEMSSYEDALRKIRLSLLFFLKNLGNQKK